VRGYDVDLIIAALAKTVIRQLAEVPGGAGAGRTADHQAILFSQKVLAVRSGICIYRLAGCWHGYLANA
jgi:hypothetical protein